MSLTLKIPPAPFWILEESLGALERVQPDAGWTPSPSLHNKHFQDPALLAGQYFHFNLHFPYACEVQVDRDVELNALGEF